jgi:NADH:ubiquinone oxidoreductase subunit D
MLGAKLGIPVNSRGSPSVKVSPDFDGAVVVDADISPGYLHRRRTDLGPEISIAS